MAEFSAKGLSNLNEMLNKLGTVPEEVTTAALKAMGDVALSAIKNSGEQMGVRDPESGTHILDKLKLSSPKTTATGGHIKITFSGTRTRGKTKTRNAEIAFVNEFGRKASSKHSSLAARPFMRTALTQKEKAIANAGEKILGDWMEKTFKK